MFDELAASTATGGQEDGQGVLRHTEKRRRD